MTSNSFLQYSPISEYPKPEEKTVALLFLSPLHRATRQVGLYFERALAGSEVLPGEGHLLSYLSAYAPAAVGDLQRVFGLKKSTLTSTLDRLEEAGFLHREIDAKDRRSFLVSLTKRGSAAAAQIQEYVDALESEIRQRITERDLAGFRRVLEAVSEATGVEVRPATMSKPRLPTSKKAQTSPPASGSLRARGASAKTQTSRSFSKSRSPKPIK